MANNIQDYVIDNGLSALATDADAIYICGQEPATYAQATATLALGNRNFGSDSPPGTVFSAPTDAADGRKVSSTAFSDGVVTASGAAVNWAVVDTVNSRLLVVGSMNPVLNVIYGSTFALPSFDVYIPNTAASS